MSTVKSVKPVPVTRYESYVDEQLVRARRRIRLLDLAAAGLGLVIGTLVYGLAMALCDRGLELPALVRQAGFVAYGVFVVVYLSVVVIQPLCRWVNPYFAARRVEQTVPGAKNSVVNWLDLRQQKLPPAIRSAIGHRAAKDLGRADLDRAISARRTSWLGSTALVLFIGVAGLFFSGGPRQFFSLLSRAFTPFTESALLTRTSLTIIQPEGGNVTVPIGHAVAFTVRVEGKIPDPSRPDSLRLLYRYDRTDLFEEQAFEPGDSNREWVTLVPAYQVHNGFWYKVAGGDAETEEYHVSVRSMPLLTGFEVNYHFRAYLHAPDLTTHDPNLQGIRGTAVTLLARANRPVESGSIEMIGAKTPVVAEPVADDPRAMRFHFVLDKEGSYRIWFTTPEGERNTDPMPYTIKVMRDQPPHVQLSVPGKDVHLPANGVLQLEGLASDDFGITGLKLQMKINGQEPVQCKPYRPDKKSFAFADNSYPQELAYKDYVDLSKLKQNNGRPLQKGMVIEYWLEATDNCDYPLPGPNVGRSQPTFKVILDDVEKEEAKKAQEQRAQQAQSQHEAKQDQQLNQKSQEKQNQAAAKDKAQSKSQENKSQQQKKNDLEQQARKVKNALDKLQKQEKRQQNAQETEQKNPASTDSRQNSADSQAKNQTQPNTNKANKGQQQKSEDKNDSRSGGQTESTGKGGGSGQPDAKPDAREGTNPKPESTPAKPNSTPNAKEGSGVNKQSADKESHGDDKQGNTAKQPMKGTNNGNSKNSTQPKPQEGTGPDKEHQKPGAEPNSKKASKPGQDQNTENAKPGQEKNGANNARPGAEKNGKNNGRSGNGSSGTQERHANGSQGHNDHGTQEPLPQPGNQPKAGNGKPKGQAGKPDKTANAEASQSSSSSSSGHTKPESQQNRSQPHGKSKDDAHPGKATGQTPDDRRPHPSSPDKGKSKNQAEKGQAGNSADQKAGQPAKGTTTDHTEGAATPHPAQKAAGGKKKAGNGHGAQPEQPGDRHEPAPDESPAAQARREKVKQEIKELAKALKGKDQAARDKAAKRLDQLQHDAKDPEIRQAAENALKKAGQDDLTRHVQGPGENPGKRGTDFDPSGGKRGSATKAGGTAPGTPREGQSTRTGKNEHGTASSAAEQKGQSNPSGGKNQRPGKPGEGGNANSQSSATGKGKAARTGLPGEPDSTGGGQVGTGSGMGLRGDRKAKGQPGRSKAPEPGIAADPSNRNKAGELQVERFPKHPSKKLLKELGWTREQYQQFLKDVAEEARKQQAAAKQEKLVDPRRSGGLLPNMAHQASKGKSQEDNIDAGGLTLPPPGFRGAYKQFTEKVSGAKAPEDNQGHK